MKKFFKEFKEFAVKGNMIDMAVGMIIGAAFTGLVGSLVNDIFKPLIAAIVGEPSFDEGLVWELNGSAVNVGTFLAAIVNFIIMAFVVFLFVKMVNRLRKLGEKKEEADETADVPTTKICPYCKSEISIDAVKCPHCTSDLPQE